VTLYPSATRAAGISVVFPLSDTKSTLGLLLINVISQLSVTTGFANVTIAPHTPGSLTSVILDGQVITGS